MYELLKCIRGGLSNIVSVRGVFGLKSVEEDALTDAQRPHTRSRACSSARNAVQSVCACLQAHTATSKFAPATITGRPREADQNALETIQGTSCYSFCTSGLLIIPFIMCILMPICSINVLLDFQLLTYKYILPI
ncbi:hypothetical protein CDL12_28879 [Handroanthus impetiginosus]|uniref:Uncharacterized protein n=1 Tax=Handroanthus impetiginosus TaxID=429701 RepID=A0A2G9G024_9LAMI|nr:hypothetical protein CDL12_28879 [Handroanthus impetiginosus]